MTLYNYVIIGGGLAAGYAAKEFAEQGITPGQLCILSAETTLPYERPPLSKDFLAGKESAEEILINPPAFYEKHGIEVKLDTPDESVNLQQKRLYADTIAISYEKLLIATGSQPRTFDLPGADLTNIFYLRQISDARRIRNAAKDAKKAVVIGGSFIGMETTAVFQSSGVNTTMVFPEKRVWDAFFTPEMSAFFERYYQEQGVTILPEQEIEAFLGDGRVTHVKLKSGRELPADLVVCGIGVTPNSALFNANKLEMKDGGILVNRFLETNLPDVFAAGDITYYRDIIYGRLKHVEHWDNAVQQGRHAARAMLGIREPFEHVPYFFSDVFDLSYEFWGDTKDATQTIFRGNVENGSFSTWWLGENGRLLAAFVMNRPEEERENASKWIKSGAKLPKAWQQPNGQGQQPKYE
jgi:NADPH-dependent 2,4-dienoyl-CoA reductase/sulfur reductase-like enzyme